MRRVEGVIIALAVIGIAVCRAYLHSLVADLVALDGVIGADGLDGRPVIVEEMSWLLHRSCLLGLPTVTVRGRTGSNAGTTRHVAVLTVGQMHGLAIPEIDDP